MDSTCGLCYRKGTVNGLNWCASCSELRSLLTKARNKHGLAAVQRVGEALRLKLDGMGAVGFVHLANGAFEHRPEWITSGPDGERFIGVRFRVLLRESVLTGRVTLGKEWILGWMDRHPDNNAPV